jgi:hypothetical protein
MKNRYRNFGKVRYVRALIESKFAAKADFGLKKPG